MDKNILSILLVQLCMSTLVNAEDETCDQWMDNSPILRHKTDKKIITSCDDKTFKVFDHEYAKDKNAVYFKPMPNATNMAIIIKTADAKTFKKLIRCDNYADKYHVFQYDKIIHHKDPDLLNGKFDRNNPKTHCYSALDIPI